ncbi:hypothetical protein [Pseudomonas helvetica]|uniref:hypothetical protein n=1 Tax=Pseudomonas helvetica TaxID=3136738 RepID=UPI003266DE7A
MSEVMRYDLDAGDDESRACMMPIDGGDYVEAIDFDRVSAEREALQQRLNAADR